MKDQRYIYGKGTFTRALVSMMALVLALMMTLASCGSGAASTGDEGAASGANESASTEASAETSADSTVETTSTSSSGELFTERDLSGEYDESSAVSIELSGTSAKASSDAGVSINGSTITISAEGTYMISGSMTDGQIIVEADETAKVQIVMNNASITSKTSAAIYVKSADKVFVTSASGTDNTLANGGSFTAIDENNIDGAVFAKDDIVFNGSGNITIESPAGHGIVGKDDVKLAGGTITINAARHGVQANNDIRVADADINIEAGKEGMEALTIYITAGDIDIAAADDGINAANSDNQSMDGGTDGSIEISGGNTYITAGGDGIDANGSVTISGGYTVICGPTQGDTSVLDYNGTATINGGTFIATGGAGMAQSFSSAENQGLISVSVGNQSAGTTVRLKDASGNTVAEVTPDLDYAVVYISTPDVTTGNSYTLEAGNYSETIELSETSYSTLGGGVGGRGGMRGGMMNMQGGQGMPPDMGQGGPGGQNGMRGDFNENQADSAGTGV